jgi:hypothetical protein
MLLPRVLRRVSHLPRRMNVCRQWGNLLVGTAEYILE